MIRNKINNKIYIGQTNNVNKRWQQHKSLSNKENVPKFLIHKAIEKYGEKNFDWAVIASVMDNTISKENINYLEMEIIKQYNCLSPYGYNLIGSSGSKVVSDETRNKISGENGPLSKLTNQKVIEIYQYYLDNPNSYVRGIAKIFGVSRNTVGNILTKKCWKQITKNFPDINLLDRANDNKPRKNKITDEQLKFILKEYINCSNQKEITEFFNKYKNLFEKSYISSIKTGRIRKNIGKLFFKF